MKILDQILLVLTLQVCIIFSSILQPGTIKELLKSLLTVFLMGKNVLVFLQIKKEFE